MSETLSALAEGIRRCTACPLWKSRTIAVPGEGPSNARIMFVGEAPGAEEDRVGFPFVGRSGKFLDEMLSVAGIERKNVFITGSCKCRPPQNRIPAAFELATCRSLWLDKQVASIKPEIIVLLGKAALFSKLGEQKVGLLHGKLIEKNNQNYFVTFHPAAGMRFPQIRELMKEDFKVLRKLKINITDRNVTQEI